jgi:vancomycin resistance protein VanW
MVLIAARRALRRTVPESLRRTFALLRRSLGDGLDGMSGAIARHIAEPAGADWRAVARVVQPIRQSPLWEGKLANIALGCGLLDGLVIAPGRVLSFWALVGRPTATRGFAIGRGIRDDRPGGDLGGGLCQLSGLVYELGLRGGLEVVERHPHSRDLYENEKERFTPLGLDATLVWPWKDLRLRNGLTVPICLRVQVEKMTLRGTLLAPVAIKEAPLRIERSDRENERIVAVWRGNELVSRDRYAIHHPG